MARLHTIGRVVVYVYANDHLPPHFHVIHPDFEALIEIETLSLMAGSLSRAARRSVMEWARENRAALVAEWNRVNPRFPVR